ncbi:MAG: FecR domain-containing protein [Bacteroidota bacterium]
MEEKILKYLEGEVSEVEREAVESWIKESEENRKAYEDYSKIVSASEGAFEGVYFDENRAFDHFKKKLDDLEAASIFINSVEETEEDSKAKKLDKSLFYKIAASLILLVGIFFTYRTFFRTIEFTAELNGQEISLPDESQVWLKKGSTISYNSYFSSRRVFLSGEAFFDVQKRGDTFVVETNNTETEVLGTEFVLNTLNEDKTTLVVVSGKVAFSSGDDESDEKVLLTENEQALYSTSEGLVKSDQLAHKNSWAWKTKVLEYNGASLREVVEDLGKLYDVEIQISNENINDCSFSGTFNKLSLEESVDILEYSMDLSFNTDQEILEVSGKGCN